MDLGEVGLFTAYRRAGYLDHFPTARAQEVVTELEELGFPALWIPEVLGRDAITHSALLLAGSRRIVVATGIASIYARDAVCMVAGERLLAEAFPQRFLLGLGVSHREAVEGLRGHRYDRPLAAMRAYLEAMDGAVYKAVEPASPPPRVLAALGPKMLALSAERADGAMPYLVPVEHTARAREIVGPGKLFAPGPPGVLEADATKARELARAHVGFYLRMENYARSIRRLGFGEEDVGSGGSDRLVEALVATGDEDAIRRRVREHLDAGADHVAVQVVNAAPDDRGLELVRTVAAALL